MTWTAPKRNITAFGLAILIWGRAIRGFAGEFAERKTSFCFLLQNIRREIRILRQDPWEMLITFIISQNNNIPARTQKQQLNHRSRKNLRNHTPVHH